MGEGACNLLEAELALDRLEAALATELPAHMRAFAAAYAGGRTPPAAPGVARSASSVALALRALPHPLLAARAVAVLRIIAPIAIEDDAAVGRARTAAPTWDALRTLTSARDQAARARFGLGALDLMHRLHGSTGVTGTAALPPAVAGWTGPCEPIDDAAIAGAWEVLARRFDVHGTLELVRSELARPRAFVVEPGSQAVLVIPGAIATPAAKFAVIHEMGHAVANLSSDRGWPRIVDEAAASYVARLVELPDALPGRWFEPRAAAARSRRTAIATALDLIEREMPVPSDLPPEQPPWALWHDPGAQAAYVGAEQIADQLWSSLGPSPGVALGTALDAERIRIDRTTVI